MKKLRIDTAPSLASGVKGSVEVATRSEIATIGHWEVAFSHQRKDHRYYELVEDTLRHGSEHRYIVLKDARGRVNAIQPFFILDQDILAGSPRAVRTTARLVRRWWPGFLKIRTLMAGCAAGEGHLDWSKGPLRRSEVELIAQALRKHAQVAKARLVVLKEFPSEYREHLHCVTEHTFTRVPSLPMVTLPIDYADFNEYMKRGISKNMRSHLRRKFRAVAQYAPIEMSVVTDITGIIDEIYPLYLQVYERSTLRFEFLTKQFFCEIGRRMPDKVRFFIWRQSGKPIAFSLSMVHGDTVYNEYLGLDYSVALKLHMYFIVFRDIMSWSIANGYRRNVSTALSYDPKLHLRFKLAPLDLYVLHTSPIINWILKSALPLLEPTRYDKILPKFSNYEDLWHNPSKSGDTFYPHAESVLCKDRSKQTS